jgi:hypothetical protein
LPNIQADLFQRRGFGSVGASRLDQVEDFTDLGCFTASPQGWNVLPQQAAGGVDTCETMRHRGNRRCHMSEAAVMTTALVVPP